MPGTVLGWCWGEVRAGQRATLREAHFILVVIQTSKKKTKNDPILGSQISDWKEGEASRGLGTQGGQARPREGESEC